MKLSTTTTTMSSWSSSNSYNNKKLSRVMQRIFSFDGNVMLAAIISLLLLLLLFVLLLHIYAEWFLALRPRRPRTSSSSPSFPLSQAPDVQTLPYSSPNPKGLHSSIIASVPLFVYQSWDIGPGELSDCVIGLSEFEEDEAGRELPRCGHRFRVECIDMWLQSHTNCPICRASVVPSDKKKKKKKMKKKKRKRELPAVAEEDSTADRGIHEIETSSGISRPEQTRGAIGSSQTSPSLEILVECDSGEVQQVGDQRRTSCHGLI